MKGDDDPRIQVPDDVSTLTGQPEKLWTIIERLVLNDGDQMTRVVARLSFEPYLGDVMATTNVEQTLLGLGDPPGVVRFQPDNESLFFTARCNVKGIYVDVTVPDGSLLDGNSIKVGFSPNRPETSR